MIEDYSHIPTHQSLDNYSVKNIKIDFPRFIGFDALQWIFQAKQFFYYHGVPDSHRLKIALVHFDGPMVPWFQMLQKASKLTSWMALTKSLESDYGPSVFECPKNTLLHLTQEGTVSQFYAQFATLANSVHEVPVDILFDCFVSGLNKEIQVELLPWQPDDLDKAATLAKVFEEKLQFGMKPMPFKSIFKLSLKILVA